MLAALAMLALHSSFAAETNTATSPPGWLTQPMSLADALTTALAQNNAILKGQRDLEATHGLVVQTRAVAWPKIHGTGNYTYNEAVEVVPYTDPIRVSPPHNEWAAGVRLDQSIYEGGRIRSAWRSARLATEQALLKHQVVIADTLLDVRTGYYAVLLAEQHIVVQEASVKLLTQELETTLHRFEAGTVPRFDVLRAEVEVAKVKPKLIRARNAHRIAKNNLAVLLGYNIPANVWEDIPLTLTGKLEAEPYQLGLPAAIVQALDRRAELGVLRKEERLRQEAIVTAKADTKPAIGLFAGYGARNSSFHDDLLRDVSGAIAGVQLNWSMYDGGQTKGRILQTRALHEKAGLELDDARRRIELQVRTAYSTFLEAREVLESQKKVQEQAEESLRLAGSRYEAGTGTQLDVLDAQTSLTEARTTQIQALYEYSVARAKLERAIGRDIPQETPPAR